MQNQVSIASDGVKCVQLPAHSEMLHHVLLGKHAYVLYNHTHKKRFYKNDHNSLLVWFELNVLSL